MVRNNVSNFPGAVWYSMHNKTMRIFQNFFANPINKKTLKLYEINNQIKKKKHFSNLVRTHHVSVSPGARGAATGCAAPPRGGAGRARSRGGPARRRS